MLATNKLSKYRSKEYCNLDMFRYEPQFYTKKKWKSKDGSIHLICKMEPQHLWHCFNMLIGIFNADDVESEIAGNALQYIGHALYKTGMQVPELPRIDFRKYINRADNLQEGFKDNPGDLFDFIREDDEDIMSDSPDWYNGEFYKD